MAGRDGPHPGRHENVECRGAFSSPNFAGSLGIDRDDSRERQTSRGDVHPDIVQHLYNNRHHTILNKHVITSVCGFDVDESTVLSACVEYSHSFIVLLRTEPCASLARALCLATLHRRSSPLSPPSRMCPDVHTANENPLVRPRNGYFSYFALGMQFALTPQPPPRVILELIPSSQRWFKRRSR